MYIKEATSFSTIMLIFAGIVPSKHNYGNPGQILSHLYVRAIIIALLMFRFTYVHRFSSCLNFVVGNGQFGYNQYQAGEKMRGFAECDALVKYDNTRISWPY
jgi:hypothetical protein